MKIKIIMFVACVLLLVGVVIVHPMAITEKNDYYRVGELVWQNEGCYNSRHPALYVCMDQLSMNGSSEFKLSDVDNIEYLELSPNGEHTYYSVIQTSMIDDLNPGDLILVKFEWAGVNGYVVTEIKKADFVFREE
jgi:hypothetical protein